jgi:hypothetical protein
MRFARFVFLLAGLYGVVSVLPLYLEDRYFASFPPAINRPEFYYGFVGVCLAWQVMFLVIASNPVRYRAAMLPAMLEKVSFAAVVPVLYLKERVEAVWLIFASIDAAWLVLFGISYLWTPAEQAGSGESPRK